MISRFNILAIVVSIPALVHSTSMSDRRARVQSIRVRPAMGGQVAWNETTTPLPLAVIENAEINDIIIQVGEDLGLKSILREVYRETPKGMILVLCAGFLFIIACILLVTVWK